MENDAQAQSPPNLDERDGDGRTNDTSNIITTVNQQEPEGILWTCGLREICLAALWLPLGALIFCYVTASIFQADDIHETHCRVYNVVPSISAITGVSPQSYVWRTCVAFHLGPRLLIGSLYYRYHKERTRHIVEEEARVLATKLGDACYWLNLIELLALNGVTYVSNRENYFVHEKIFIVFMIVTLLHMLCRAWVGCVGSDVVEPVRTNKQVWTLFFIGCVATIGVIVFFLKHRLLCEDLAFTWFSVCEYILAIANMAFHGLIVIDFPLHRLQVVSRPPAPTNTPAHNETPTHRSSTHRTPTHSNILTHRTPTHSNIPTHRTPTHSNIPTNRPPTHSNTQLHSQTPSHSNTPTHSNAAHNKTD